MSYLNSAGLAALVLLVATAAVRAQEPEESAREAAEQELRAAEEREDLRESRTAGAIAFERILAAPEDVDLNLAYARERIAAGDLKEGAAAIERILLQRPELHEVRVLYGLVLYRMGMYDRARFELEKALESDMLSQTVRAEAEAYLARINREQRLTRGSLTVSVGVEYDRNRNQSPSSGQILFSIPNASANPTSFFTTVLDADPRNGDVAWIASVSGRLTRDLGSQDGHTLHAEAGYYRSDKVEVDNLDLDAINLALGGTWNWGRFSVTPRFRGSQIWLEGKDYLRAYGGELEILMRVRPDLRAYLVFRGEDEDFRATPNFQSAPLRTGRRLSARPGVAWNFSPTMALRAEGLIMDKKGQAGFESYERYGAFAQHSWLLGRGAFSLIGGWAEKSEYDSLDPFIGPIVRDEWLYRARVSIGAPLSFFAPGLSGGIGDINLIAQYEYETVDSNIINFDYDTHKVSLLLSKRFGF